MTWDEVCPVGGSGGESVTGWGGRAVPKRDTEAREEPHQALD